MVNSRHTIGIVREFEFLKSRRAEGEWFEKRTFAQDPPRFRQPVVCCQIKELAKRRVRSLSADRQENTAQAAMMERDGLELDSALALIGQRGRFKVTANCQPAGRDQ